jgi:hypothetical protein
MIITLNENRLADRYVIAVHDLPKELRMRKPLEETVMDRLCEGRNVCIRGFWRIGKTELMKASVAGACNRTMSNGFFLDMRSSENQSGVPETKEEAIGKLGDRVERFFQAAGADINVDMNDPLRSLEIIDGPVFVAIDEMIALQYLGEEGMKEIISMIKNAPSNVRLTMVCHRHASVDGIFESEIANDAKFETIFVPPLTDAEFSHIVTAPAAGSGVTFTDEAVSKLSALSGGKPWEAFIFCHILASELERVGGDGAGLDAVDEFVTFESVMNNYFGREVIENYARILLKAASAGERDTLFRIATGDSPSDTDAVNSLVKSGWLKENGLEINSLMFGDFIRKVASGELNIRQE